MAVLGYRDGEHRQTALRAGSIPLRGIEQGTGRRFRKKRGFTIQPIRRIVCEDAERDFWRMEPDIVEAADFPTVQQLEAALFWANDQIAEVLGDDSCSPAVAHLDTIVAVISASLKENRK